MDDLSKRLREMAERDARTDLLGVIPDILREAADARDARDAEVERLREALEWVAVIWGEDSEDMPYLRRVVAAVAGAALEGSAVPTSRWQTMESAPRDELILVWFDHDADPYFRAEAQTHPTDYAVWAECTCDFLSGHGVAFAKWQKPVFEAKDEYGGGVWLPAWWCAYENGDYERAVNPTHWQPLPPPPEDG